MPDEILNVKTAIEWLGFGAIVAAATLIQSWWKQRKDDRAAEKLAVKAELAVEAAKKTSGKIDSVVKSLNGQGLMGAMNKVIGNQGEHEIKDVERFEAIDGRIGSLEDLITGKKKLGGPKT